MKEIIKNFCRRGLMWGAWSGPVILAIVWMCLGKAGVIGSLTVREAVLGIFSTAIMGFIAAGVSVVYTVEALPRSFAALIQGAVLYIDYLGFYLLNGWLPAEHIWLFTVIFAAGFIAIWLSIYVPIRVKVARLNRMQGK